MKKALSFLLAFVMILGVMPVGAMAADGWTDHTVAGGTFVDESAEPGKSYEYTIQGSDGSEQTIQVLAEPATGTGNKIDTQTGTVETYYQKVTDLEHIENGTYLLVAGKKAVTHEPDLTDVTVSGDRINGEKTNLEWNVTASGNKISFATGNKYLKITDRMYKKVEVSADKSEFELESENNGSFTLKNNSRYLKVDGNSLEAKKNSGSSFTLYRKVTEPAGTTYTVNTAGLDALLAQADEKVKSQYERSTWTPFEQAREAARNAKASLNNPYTDQNEANTALTEINRVHHDLLVAMENLKKVETPDPEPPETQPVDPEQPVDPAACVKPKITWHRTKEPGNWKEQPVENVQHLADRSPWLDISWDWDDVKYLKASDPNPWNAGNGKATWDKGYTGDWTDSSVRRFTGTFTWPEGVGMDGTMTIQSVNDADYKFIYDYIARDPELQARYGNAKVLPINDDMYVFISKVSDGEPSSWTQAEAKDHLMFWTGTTGKGAWSQHGSTDADWGRTEPARFEGKSATPAYHGSWPNLVDRGNGTNANVQNWDLRGKPSPMPHTDNWYTLTDTNAMKSTLNELYGAHANLAGQQMRIDIYAFDNSASGGMDELELILCPAKKDDVQVTVRYWLDQVQGTQLGTSTMTKKVGDVVNLPQGTNTNELNYQKAEAIRQSGADTDISNGEQVQKNYVVKKDGNIIDVVYKRSLQDMKFFTYDFGVQNQYFYKDENDSAIESVRVECATDTIGISHSGHDITLTYTPKDALGKPVNATLVVERRGNTNRYPIMIIPASNVLYEESFIKAGEDWSASAQSRAHGNQVTDNGTTVYGFTDAYADSAGENKSYTATMPAKATTAGSLTFSFNGLGFDLIGSCGPDTGAMLVRVADHTGHMKTRNYMVDTHFSGETIYQVPLVHFISHEATAQGAQFDVTVTGFNTYQDPAAPAVLSADSSSFLTPDMYEAMLEMGMTEEEISEIEYIGAEDILSENMVSTFSAAPAAAGNGTQTVSVDSFRVYRASANSSAAYPANEQDVTYTNVLDTLNTDHITAFVEQGEDGASYAVTEYEAKGGPENEVYLASGQSIAIKAGSNAKIQVSLRNVYGDMAAAAKINGNQTIRPNHNTEMYYEVSAGSDGIVTIQNTGAGLLAIGNVKHQAALQTVSEADYPVIFAMLAGPAAPAAPEFEIRFELNDDDLAWADSTAATEVKTFTVSTETDGVTAPGIVTEEDEQLVRWDAVEIPLSLSGDELLTAQSLEENFDWTGTERVITFRPVIEEIEQEDAFEPEHFDVRLGVERGYSAKYVNVNVEASDDVAYITVNGQRVDARNADWVEFGFDPYYIFVTDLEYGRNEEVVVEIVAYNENGDASEVTLARE